MSTYELHMETPAGRS